VIIVRKLSKKEKRVNLVNIKSLGEKMKRGSRVYEIE
jgi:hypothetical protein